MKISFSDRIVELSDTARNPSEPKSNPKTYAKPNDTIKKVTKISKIKTDYVTRVVNTQNFNAIHSKNYNETQKDPNEHNKQNAPNSQRYRQITTKINQKTSPNQQKYEKIEPANFRTQTRLQRCLSQEKVSTKKLTIKPSKFVDKHMSTPKKLPFEQTQQTYKRFDITKLDFSFDCNLNQQQISAQKLTKEKQYTSLVSKSRSNIKRIIQLNKFLKESQKEKNKYFQKTEDQKFLSDLEIIDKIKVGCFGTVFKARILSTGKLIAIKSVPYDRKNQQREEQICRIIDNPFIVKIHKVYYTSDIEIEQKEKVRPRKTQNPLQTSKALKNQISTCKSVRRLFKNPTKNHIEILPENDDQQLNLNEELKKNFINKTKQSRMQEHYNEYHRIINIAMDLYDCDLNDYIITKMKIDNLTLKLFCYQMIRSLLYLHSHQICHRDIKPNNFLVKKHLVVLTDFGSAKIMKNHKNSNIAYICSRYYRAPELILGYKYYDKPVDIWSLGCVMAELALGKPIFKGSNSLDQLVRIIRVIGQPNWRSISFMMDKIPKLPQIQSKGLKNVFPPNVSPLFIDLLENMLVINPLQRITAGQALCHPFFDELRDQMNFQQICNEMDISHFLKFNRDELKQNEHLKNKLIPLWAAQPDRHQSIKTNNYLRS